MVRNLEHLKQSAPSPFLLDLVETAWSWRGQEQAISKRPRSGVVDTITEVAPDPATPSASQPVYWPKILSRPKILVDIGDQAPETGIGGLARESTGWVFKDFATNSDVANMIAAIPPPRSLSLNDLTDVTLSSILPGHQLGYDGAYWVNEPGPRHRFPINNDGSYDFTLSYNPATKILTMTPVGVSFYVHINGVKHTFTGTQTLPAHTTAERTFVFVNESGQLATNTTGFNLLANAPVAIIFWDAVAGTGFCVPETHTDRMSARTHERLHSVQGAEAGRRSGFAISGYTYNLDTVAGVTFGVSGGDVWDEDIEHVIPNFADGTAYTIFRRTGATGSWTWETASALPYKTGTDYATSNVFATGAWGQQELDGSGTGQFMNMFVVALPNINISQIILVQGQGVFATQALAEAQTWDTLDVGQLPSFEMPALYQIVLKSQVALGTATKKTVIVSIKKATVSGGGAGVGGSAVHNSLPGRSDADTHPFSSLTGLLGAAQFPALSGDVFNTAGSVDITVSGLKGHSLPPLGGAGNLRWNGFMWGIDSNAYAFESDLGDYVLKAGDTMSGSLMIALTAPDAALKIYGPIGANIAMTTTTAGLDSVISMNVVGAAWAVGAMNSNPLSIPVGSFAVWGPTKAYFWQTNGIFSHRTNVETTGSFAASSTITSVLGNISAPNGRVASYWAAFSALSLGGIVKAAPSTGELGLASESDLPGGPFLHASGGSTNKIAKWLSATSLGYGIASDDGSTFSVAGNGAFTGYAGAGNARMQSWYANPTALAWFGWHDQNNGSGASGFLQENNGNSYVCAPSERFVEVQVGGTSKLKLNTFGVNIPSLISGGIVEAAPGTGLLGLASASGLRKYLDMPESEIVFGSTAFGISSSPRARFYGDEIHLDNEARIRFHPAKDLGRGGNIRAKYNSARASAELIIESGSQSDGNGGVRIDVNDGGDITPVATFEGGGTDYEGPCSIFHENAYFKKNIDVGSMRNRVPHIYTDSSTLPVLGVNEWCFLVCDDPTPTSLRWRTNSTQGVRVRSGGTTYTTAAGGNVVSDSAAINVNYVTCILIGPTRSDSNICSFIPF